MSKKKVPKKAKVKEKKTGSSGEPAKAETFDFGGLPERDLKKNLGCG